MPCTDDTRPKQGAGWLRSMARAGARLRAGLAGLAGLGLLAGCGSNASAPDANPPPAATSRATSATGGTGTAGPGAAPTTPAAPGRTAQSTVKLPPPATMRNWDDVRKQAAQRMVAANPGGTYMGVPPEPLLPWSLVTVFFFVPGTRKKIMTNPYLKFVAYFILFNLDKFFLLFNFSGKLFLPLQLL